MVPGLTTSDLRHIVSALGGQSPAADDAGRIDRIRLLEEIKAAAAAEQARETVAFKAAQLAAQETARVPVRDRGKGISAQVALARRESPHRGARLVGLAEALVGELPHTLAALTRGEISEWRATIVARETACLSREDRGAADRELAGRLATLGDRQVEAEAKRIAYRLDPHAFMARIRGQQADRRVTLRPAPTTMSLLTGFLPVAQGVAAYAALTKHADSLRAAGDERTRAQIMADTLVERVTGQASAEHTPVEVQVIMSDQTLLGSDNEPAELLGYGPLPASLVRNLVRDSEAEVWLRRLYAEGGRLVGLESSRRIFPEGLRRQVVARDRVCRTPWCDAAVRHIDHAVPAEAGGSTSESNGQGLCEACNLAKQATGWRARPGPAGAGQLVDTTTPTGHRYVSRPPDPPGMRSARAVSVVEAHFGSLVAEFAAA
jgi:hypothetical protein